MNLHFRTRALSRLRRTRLRGVLAAAALWTAFGAAAQAEVPAADAQTGTRWMLGLGVAAERGPYRDVEGQVRVLPLLHAENRWFSIAGTAADFKLGAVGGLSLRLRARHAFDGYDADDSPALRGMHDRRGSLWLGAAAHWRTPLATVSAEALADAGGRSHGQRLRLGVERSFMLGSFALTPRLAATRFDRNWVDYYYGVRADEVRPGRPAYAGVATTSVEAGVRLAWRSAAGQGLAIDVGHTRFGRGVGSSPITGRSDATGLRSAWLVAF